jgi:hypothetical protein
MDIEDVLKDINKEDFLIRIRPLLTEEDEWTGQIDLSVMTFPQNPLDDDDYTQLMHFSKMICSSVPVMEAVEEFREMLHNFVMSQEEEIDISLEDDVEKTYDGNVVHLNFNTKTGGSA